MQYLYERVVDAEKADGVDRIYFPGELEQLQQQERERTGIPLVQAEIDALNVEADKVGVAHLRVKPDM